MRIKVDDLVEVIAGNYKGVRGEVLRVLPKANRVVVKGVNIVTKHQRPQQAGGRQAQGGIIEFEAPIDASNVMVVDPETDRPTRIGIRFTENGEKIRYAKRSGMVLD